MSKKKDNVSVIVRPTRTLMNRWGALAQKYNRESANQLIVEIAEWYTDMWEEMESTRLDVQKQQWERMREMLKLPIRAAAAESGNKTHIQGKKGSR